MLQKKKNTPGLELITRKEFEKPKEKEEMSLQEFENWVILETLKKLQEILLNYREELEKFREKLKTEVCTYEQN